MNLPALRRILARRPKFVPGLEALEDRSLLSVTATFSAGTLVLNGDNSGNKITITDPGNGTITVAATGVQKTPFHNVNHIIVNGGNGGNTLTYNLTGALQESERLEFNLGNGASNKFTGMVTGNIPEGMRYRLGVQGGRGKDNIAVTYQGKMRGVLTLNAVDNTHVQPGNADKINYQINLNPHSNGTINPHVQGGGGNDNLQLFVNQARPTDRPTVNGARMVNGDGGLNTCLSALPISEINCQM
jgi:hypothetical protein